MFSVFCCEWQFSTQSGLGSDIVPGIVPCIKFNSTSFIAESLHFLWKTKNHKAHSLMFFICHSCCMLNIYLSCNKTKYALMWKLYFNTQFVFTPTCLDLSWSSWGTYWTSITGYIKTWMDYEVLLPKHKTWSPPGTNYWINLSNCSLHISWSR